MHKRPVHGALGHAISAQAAGLREIRIEAVISRNRLRPRHHTTSYPVTETSAAALCMTDGFARVVARNSAWMQKRRGYIVSVRDARMLLVVIESDEVFVFGAIYLYRSSKVYCQSLNEYLLR